MSKTINFDSQDLKWGSFVEFQKKLYKIIYNQNELDVIVNLTGLLRIFPNGIIPLISWIDRARREKNATIKITAPSDSHLKLIATHHNWLHLLDSSFPPGEDGYRGLMARRFTNDTELNEIIINTLEFCLHHLQLKKGVMPSFEWALNELAGNVLVHADAPGYIQVITYTDNKTLDFIVCDSGCGILYNFQKAFGIQDHIEALEKSLQARVTTNPERGQGNGLTGSYNIALRSSGAFYLRSGKGVIEHYTSRTRSSRFLNIIPGTCVELQIPIDNRIDLSSILGHEPTNHIEIHYMDDDCIKWIKLVDHEKVLGNRITGDKIRTLILNIANEYSQFPIGIDFDGIGILASSFADEVFGKIRLELGYDEFKRFHFKNLSQINKTIIEKAISERLELPTTFSKDSA